MKLQGKKIVITGAAGGLGYRVAHLLSESGATVVGLDVKDIEGDLWEGGKFFRCDVTEENELAGLTPSITSFLDNRVDILINNAGTLALQDAALKPTNETKKSFDVNFWGVWNVTSKMMPYLQESKGKLINVASLFAYVNAPLIPSYTASKRAVSGFSDAIRMQYKNEINVTTVYPGFINTGIHDSAVRQGLSVEEIIDIRLFGFRLIRVEESVSAAAKGVVRACKNNYRNIGSTRVGSLSLWFARHMPSFVDLFVSIRVNHLINQGVLKISLDEPQYNDDDMPLCTENVDQLEQKVAAC